jgi:hypothetical protein
MAAGAEVNTAGRGLQPHGEAMAKREMRWDECGFEQKVERIRGALLEMEGVIEATHRRANEALAVAKVHGHDPMGNVMTPAAPTYRDRLDELHYEVRHIFARLR